MIAAPLPTPLVGLLYRKLLFTCSSVMVGFAALWQTQPILKSDEV
jgi:hypothetical protein